MCAESLSLFWLLQHYRLLYTRAHKAAQSKSMWFSRQEYWSGFPFPPPGDLPDSGTESSPALQADSLLSEPQGKRNTGGSKFSASQKMGDMCYSWYGFAKISPTIQLHLTTWSFGLGFIPYSIVDAVFLFPHLYYRFQKGLSGNC